MSITTMAEAQEQALGIFADAVLKLALHIQQQAMEADDLDQKVRAAGAVHRLGRGARCEDHRRAPAPRLADPRRRTLRLERI